MKQKCQWSEVCVAGSAATFQVERNIGSCEGENNDVDVWMKETNRRYMRASDVVSLIASFNACHKNIQVMFSGLKFGHQMGDRLNMGRIGRRMPLHGYNSAPLGFVVNIHIFNLNERVTRTSQATCKPIQLIGLWCSEEDELPFSTRVVKGFDLTCVQCYIPNPICCKRVQYLNENVKSDIENRTMMYNMERFDTGRVFERCIGKYMDRGYRLNGLRLSSNLILYFDNAVLINNRTKKNVLWRQSPCRQAV